MCRSHSANAGCKPYPVTSPAFSYQARASRHSGKASATDPWASCHNAIGRVCREFVEPAALRQPLSARTRGAAHSFKSRLIAIFFEAADIFFLKVREARVFLHALPVRAPTYTRTGTEMHKQPTAHTKEYLQIYCALRPHFTRSSLQKMRSASARKRTHTHTHTHRARNRERDVTPVRLPAREAPARPHPLPLRALLGQGAWAPRAAWSRARLPEPWGA